MLAKADRGISWQIGVPPRYSRPSIAVCMIQQFGCEYQHFAADLRAVVAKLPGRKAIKGSAIVMMDLVPDQWNGVASRSDEQIVHLAGRLPIVSVAPSSDHRCSTSGPGGGLAGS